jgi:hypothetical protein
MLASFSTASALTLLLPAVLLVVVLVWWLWAGRREL